MNYLILLIEGILALGIGSILGYLARRSIAKKRADTIEQLLQRKISEAKKESQKIVSEAKERSQKILDSARNNLEQRQGDLLKTERILLKRENIFDKKISDFESQENIFQEKVKKLKEIKENIENLKAEAVKKLEQVSGLPKEKAKQELLKNLELEYQAEILERMKKLELEGESRFEKKAKEILATVIQRYTLSQVQDITTTTLALPSEDIKGRIIGKEGRNIKTLEKLTGVEVIIDETPESLLISGFDQIRRQIAKTALEKLIKDGRIQPARIEEKVEEAKKEITSQIKEAGETAVYEIGLLGLNEKLIQLLGRLKFRTSYGQNVLLHSIEVSYLAAALAAEIGADAAVCKKAGLLHDIGKAVDQQIEGSHVDIGIKILEKFNIEPKVISAMKSHHEDYPYESIEAIIVQVADQISGARPGARKDTVENYLKRLGELEGIANSFPGVEKTWALQAGREIRVFVRPQEIDDLSAQKLARDIAKRIQEELRYPGEIKVNVIRETRVIEYAK